MKYFFYIIIIIEFCFSYTVSISGIIFNNESKPSRKVNIKLYDIDNNLVTSTKTTRKGRFEITNIIPDYYFLHAEHPKDGNIILKINPRNSRNRDLILRLTLSLDKSIPLVYTFANIKPIEKDPALKIKGLKSKTSVKSIAITWDNIKQAGNYEIYRDNSLFLKTKSNVFIDSTIKAGMNYCYEIIANGKYGISGVKSDPLCNNALTDAPSNILGFVNKNNITLKWKKTEGAGKYKIFRNGENISTSEIEVFEDRNLDFSTKYFYSIASISPTGVEGLTSQVFEITTRDYVEPPALSSLNTQTSIKLIWNEVNLAKSYNLYRNGGLIGNLLSNSYEDKCIPGETHCYQISSIDKYNVESELSSRYCTKLNLKSPSDLTLISGVKNNQISWKKVSGAFEYLVFESFNNDSTYLLHKTKNISFIHKGLGYDDERCYAVIAVDSDGDKSGFSKPLCGKTKGKPSIKIKNLTLIDESEDNVLDAREKGILRFAIINDGESPSENISLSIRNVIDNNMNLVFDSLKVIENLNVGEALYVDFNIGTKLKIESGDWKFQINVKDENGLSLVNPYDFTIRTKAIDSPNIILADYSIENSFGTNYIPKDEVVNLTLRIQNVGAGLTEKVDLMLIDNHTYSSVDFTGLVQLDELQPGDYRDIDVKIKSSKEKFAVKLETIDFLDKKIVHQIDLVLMKQYRSKADLKIQEIGALNVIPYPIQAGEVDIEQNIPIGKRNVNNMAILLAVNEYDDINLNQSKYAGRDLATFRLYMQNLFGMDDFQLYPSKLWQMEDGPTKNDLEKIFDPHQGVIRNRVISSNKYSNIDFVDITVFYSGLGYWINGKPHLIPRDGKKLDSLSYADLEQILTNLSRLSVLENINSITIYLDIKYINFREAKKDYKYPELSKKLCILASSSASETSQESEEMKHSVFSYFLMKGLKGDAIGDDKILEIGELAEYLYIKVPEYTNRLSGGIIQNPEFIGSDLKRVLIDLR